MCDSTEADNDLDLEEIRVDALPGRGSHVCIEVRSKSLLLCNVSGTYYAVANQCPHLGFPLAGGRQVGNQLICQRHGASFDLRTGIPVSGPTFKKLETFPVKQLGEKICIGFPVDQVVK